MNEFAPAGHYYSPIPNLDEIKLREKELFSNPPKNFPGIDLNERAQLETLRLFGAYYREQPFSENKAAKLRYYFKNSAFSYADALVLYCMIRHLKPKRIIEIGSGYSSCVTLDTNELFFDNKIACTFIEPHPELLQSLLKSSDADRIKIIPQKLQEVDSNIFAELSSQDILFIDSTHVAKIGSDVNLIFSKILPMLKKDVFIHFHDIFYNFDYPAEWVFGGRAWNEAYVLRAFLQYNDSFKIQYFNSMLGAFYAELVRKEMPLCLKNQGGSIWIKKLGNL